MTKTTNPFMDQLEIDAKEHDSERFNAVDDSFRPEVEGLSLYFPDHKVPAGKVYGWLAENVHGEYQRDNMRKMFAKGWEPVPAQNHPEYFLMPMPGENQYPAFSYDYIRVGGSLLCMMDKDRYDKYAKRYQQEAQARLESNNWMASDKGLQGAPFFDRGSSASFRSE